MTAKKSIDILEKVRSYYRTTASNRKVRWDEPGERDDNPDVIKHNLAVSKRLKRKKEAQRQLKANNKVPIKDGKPMFEDYETIELYENINKFLQQFRKNLYSSKRMTFREWCSSLDDLLDFL